MQIKQQYAANDPYQEVHDDDRHGKEKDDKDNMGSVRVEDYACEVVSSRRLV